MNFLITGLPSVGKTTIIKDIAGKLKALKSVGFYTSEIRERDRRIGFELIDLSERGEILAHVDFKSPFMVSKYGVNVKGFESFIDSIPFWGKEIKVAIIGEIGKMELFSNKFRRFICDILDSDKVFIATIALRGEKLTS